MFIQFGANILLGAVILVIGFWLANVVANVIQRGEYNSSRWLANLVRILIMGLVIAMGLKAYGYWIPLEFGFWFTLGSVAVAFALAFWFWKWSSTCRCKALTKVYNQSPYQASAFLKFSNFPN